ncbi:MAG: response regulator [Clostridia bacterium]|nr:response regulator [Clostridia bacterium]
MNNKIRILVADNDQDTTNEIVNSIKELDYVEVVGMAIDGLDTYNKIIELKPEIVFSKYNLDKMDGLEVIRKTKEKLQTEMPMFNIITSVNIPDEQLQKTVLDVGTKLSNLIRTDTIKLGIVKDIMNDYKENR